MINRCLYLAPQRSDATEHEVMRWLGNWIGFESDHFKPEYLCNLYTLGNRRM